MQYKFPACYSIGQVHTHCVQPYSPSACCSIGQFYLRSDLDILYAEIVIRLLKCGTNYLSAIICLYIGNDVAFFAPFLEYKRSCECVFTAAPLFAFLQCREALRFWVLRHQKLPLAKSSAASSSESVFASAGVLTCPGIFISCKSPPANDCRSS